jgi:glycosyltransferase involved in cell wall biosynthesis
LNSDSPKVTVLMPVYNGEKYLEKAIESVLTQTFRDFEFIIINDGEIDSNTVTLAFYLATR